MRSDEEQIRDLVATWIEATKAGQVDTILSLMSDDVVFLIPGRSPKHKQEFAALAKAQASPDAPRFDGTSEIQEIKIFGDWTFAWMRLHVVATSADGSPPIERAGYTLSVSHKQNGAWLLARDANLLAPIQHSQN